ncbi:MAG: Na+/H+ antiporter subunit C [Anaerolineales bacterium]
MQFVLPFVVGLLYAVGFYLMMRRSLFKLILGLALVGHASNLLIFTAGRLTRDDPPIIHEPAEVLMPPFSDPLPQALILTAIVIGFGVQAFAIVLLRDVHKIVNVDDFDELSDAE